MSQHSWNSFRTVHTGHEWLSGVHPQTARAIMTAFVAQTPVPSPRQVEESTERYNRLEAKANAALWAALNLDTHTLIDLPAYGEKIIIHTTDGQLRNKHIAVCRVRACARTDQQEASVFIWTSLDEITRIERSLGSAYNVYTHSPESQETDPQPIRGLDAQKYADALNARDYPYPATTRQYMEES